MLNTKEELPCVFVLVQFGVGIAVGAENVAHDVRNTINLNPNKVPVSLDLKNAFNSVKREVFLRSDEGEVSRTPRVSYLSLLLTRLDYGEGM